MEFLVYCNTDDKGSIVEAIDGVNIIPDKQYDYFFFLNEEVDLLKYRVGVKDGTPTLVELSENAE